MNIKHFFLRGLRQIGKRVAGTKSEPNSPIDIRYTGQEASDLIYEYMSNDKPCMIGRLGACELQAIVNYIKLAKNFNDYLLYIKGEDIKLEWEKNRREGMRTFAGFFPSTDENLEEFSRLMLDECIPNVDILGSWLLKEIHIKDKLTNAKLVKHSDIEPYYHDRPWSRILKGKTVLVVHPFVETIKNQYARRDKIFKNKDILPEFKLETIKAVQSIAHNDCGYKSWFDALDAMKHQITQKEYDIALIGCGAYGFPLASFVKDQGKKAVHTAGATQVLFGIKGGRWDEDEFFSKHLYNEYWVRPSKEETPQNHKRVEDGAYW